MDKELEKIISELKVKIQSNSFKRSEDYPSHVTSQMNQDAIDEAIPQIKSFFKREAKECVPFDKLRLIIKYDMCGLCKQDNCSARGKNNKACSAIKNIEKQLIKVMGMK